MQCRSGGRLAAEPPILDINSRFARHAGKDKVLIAIIHSVKLLPDSRETPLVFGAFQCAGNLSKQNEHINKVLVENTAVLEEKSPLFPYKTKPLLNTLYTRCPMGNIIETGILYLQNVQVTII